MNKLYSLLPLVLWLALAPAVSSNILAQKKPEQQQRPAARQVKELIRIRWNAQPGVTRYRLQIARDQEFKDIIFDRTVMGNEYTVTDLPSGSYYWHVAPAMGETGRYSRPRPVELSEDTTAAATETAETVGSKSSDNAQIMVAPAASGWRTATGPIVHSLAAQLRSGNSSDLIAVNSDGMVYALDGANGVALWTARYRPNAKRGEPTGDSSGAPFTPIVLKGKDGLANILLAFDGGLRALSGSTGRELWRVPLTQRPLGGTLVELDNSGTSAVVIASNNPATLTIINSETGSIISQTKLEKAVVGPPTAFSFKELRGIALSLEDGYVETRNGRGERLQTIKMDTAINTPPLFVAGPQGPLVLVGTESGLIALDANDLHPLGRVATEGDAPRGVLTAIDLDRDNAPEVVMLTRNGRLVVVKTSDGKIKWYTSGATDAASATFADLNGDGVLDVIAPAGQTFALGFSGVDGSLIWKAEGETKGAAAGGAMNQLRALAILPPGNLSTPLLIGGDSSRTGIRAIGLPSGSVKISER
jgi:outer membrane protein assembly factor BamB